MSKSLNRSQCPICQTVEFTVPRPDLLPHPYIECLHCGFYYQKNLIEKVYEGCHEQPGDTMSEQEREVNRTMAASLNSWFPKALSARTSLDIGSKYPWLSHCLGNLGWQSHAIDGIPEILSFTKNENLHVKAYQCDFELHGNSGLDWPWDGLEQHSQTSPRPDDKLRFDLITLIHVIEHFYLPLPAMQSIFSLLKPGGILFVRCPDSRSPGIERDFTSGHYDIHPQIWCQRALEIAGLKSGFSVRETYPLYGQRDIVFVKSAAPAAAREGDAVKPEQGRHALTRQTGGGQTGHRLTLGVGMIVKNEEDDLPDCLASLRDVADVICIVDTGSTDQTLRVIRRWAETAQWNVFFDGELPDEVAPKTLLVRSYTGASEQDETGDWKLWNFSQARNQYVDTLNRLTRWILWMDADDILLEPEKLRPLLDQPQDVFGFGIVNGARNFTTRFIHHRLWRTGLGIEYQGACHEYPYWPGSARVAATPLNIQHRWTSHPGQEAGPSRNLRILEREYQRGIRTPRLLFYLGNTLKDAGQHEKAIAAYQEYLNQPVGFWDESVFCMLYKMRCERHIAFRSGDYTTFFFSLFSALAKEQRFSEIPMEAAYAYFDLGIWHKSIAMCHYALQSLPASVLFIELDKYSDQPHRILARCYQQLGDWERAVYHTGQVLKLVPDDADMRKQMQAWSANIPATASQVNVKPEIHVNRPGAAGDIMLTLHVLERYKQQHPQARIIYYCATQFKDLPGISAAVSEVRDSKDFASCPPAGSFNFIGYPYSEGYPGKPMQHHLLHYFAREMGLQDSFADYGFKPRFGPVANPVLAAALTTGKIISLHCKAGWSPYKNWPIASWRALIARLKAHGNLDGYRLIQIGAADDPALDGVLDLRGQLSLVESVQLIKAAALHVGVDSFSNHATALLPHTPAVILWGSTSPVGSGYGHNTNLWKAEFGCSPCYREYDTISADPKGKCPHDETRSWVNPAHPCMQAIGVDEVLSAILEKLCLN